MTHVLTGIVAGLAASLLANSCAAASEAAANLAVQSIRAPWVADRGDGTYRNPVLYADYSDPDAIRVGEDYWLTSSSFNHVPGLPILHSRDLVNWQFVNHALPRLVPYDHFRQVRHGGGVWAPSLRFHGGKFWIYYPDPDFGLYVVAATDPRQAWAEPVLVKAGKGLIDPCPFWDDDGQLYLVHGWAHSRGPISNRLSLMKLSADGMRVEEESKDIIDANKLEGWRTLEGPKLYKRHGYYYVFAPAGGVKEGYQAVFRAKNIYGPYENRIVLDQASSPINGPHQGAWVDTPAGENWFLHFQDKGPYGRVVHLQPMIWREDDWPAMGTAVQLRTERGAPVLTYKKPDVPKQAISVPAMSDQFDEPQLGLQWQWQANPEADWASLTDKPGSLRLRAVPPPQAPSLYDAPSLLLQKFPGPEFTTTTAVDAAGLREGDEAGLIVFGYAYGWIGVRRDAAGLHIVQTIDDSHSQVPHHKAPVHSVFAPLTANQVWLRVSVGANASCAFSYSTDQRTFKPLSDAAELQAEGDRWVGAKVGVFAAHVSDRRASTAKGGYADFAWFHVTR